MLKKRLALPLVLTLVGCPTCDEPKASVLGIGGQTEIVEIFVAIQTGGNALDSLVVGDSTVLTALAFNGSGEPLSSTMISWSSSSGGVATVENGVVKGVAPGTSTISATARGKADTITATIVEIDEGPPPPADLGEIEIVQESILLTDLGETFRFTATAVDSMADPISPTMTWRSTNTQVATVASSGRVTAIDYGTAFILASSSCCSPDTARVTVRAELADEELSWFCDWRHTTGPSNPAVFGNPSGRKPSESSPAQCFDAFAATGGFMLDSVTTAEGKGFPPGMENVLNIYWDSDLQPGGGNIQVGHRNGAQWAGPEVGEYIYYRIYDKNMRAPGSRVNAHMIHMGTNESHYIGRWFTNTSVFSNGTYNLAFQTWLPSGQGRGAGSFAPAYGTDEQRVYNVYRREWRAHRFHADSVRWQLRVYDQDDNLFQTGADYLCGAGDCQDLGGRLADTLGAYAHSVPNGYWDGFEGLEIGNNGSEGGDPSAVQHWYWGGYAIRVTSDPNGWIGAYPTGPERN